MSVAVRVIPCLDVDAGRVVKGVNFIDLRDAGDPVEMAAVYDAEGADELVFLDITASSSSRETTYDVVRRTAEQVFIPLTVGGGSPLGRGRRPAAARPAPTRSASTPRRSPVPSWSARSRSGSARQVLVLSLDARRVPPGTRPASGFEVTTHGGRTRHRHRRGRLGPRQGATRRRRDPAQLDGRRRHQGRLRPGAASRRCGRPWACR